jgi:outer membrane protein OmpA-like peptidoglycan-associated protein
MMTKGRVVLVASLVFVNLVVVTVLARVNSIEDGLERDGQIALNDAAIMVRSLDVDGRTVVVVPVAGSDGSGALSVLSKVRGVRRVEVASSPVDGLTLTIKIPPPTTGPASTTTRPAPTTSKPVEPTTSAIPTTTRPQTLAQQMEAILVADGLRFEGDSDQPTEHSKSVLDEVALLLQATDVQILVTGHHVGLDSEEANQQLSLERAWAVAGYLEYRGIGFERMMVSGVGSEQPASSGDDNERVDLSVAEGG